MSPRSAAAALVALLCLLAPASPATAKGSGLRLVSSRSVDGRLSELAFRTPLVAGNTGVRVLVPSGYGRSARRYPVLYLLHGAVDDYRSWTNKGQAEQLTAGLPLIVVMPDTGPGGGYTDWYNGGAGGTPAWESYHVGQLIPWIDAHYRTLGTRAARAVAGLSMGGFGAMSYAARHPDLFAGAASFSGAVDTNNPLDIAVTGNEVFGPRLTQAVRWRGHNPWELAANVSGLSLFVRTGNGLPGGPFGGGDIVEIAVHQMSVSFHDRLARLGIPHLWDDYGPGGHTWPYWQRDLRETLPALVSRFAHPRAAPSPVRFTAIEPDYDVFGWRVHVRRTALEFSTLGAASVRGFTLTGSGRGTVVTARLYPPGAVEVLRIRDAGGARSVRRAADRLGRLHVGGLDLGPANPYQQYTVQADARGERFGTASVRVDPRR